MSRMDDHRCKHCDALIALIPRATILNKFGVRCALCGVTTIIWPLARKSDAAISVLGPEIVKT